MRIAVVGSGIAGMASAWLLSRKHDVTLFEAGNHFGGHTHTHDVVQQGQNYRIDSGFIVHNPAHYPLLTRLFDQIGVQSQPTTMSFSVHNEASGLEYNASTLNSLFCQRRNLCSPRFIRMVRDLTRFYREAPMLLDSPGEGPTLGDYLAQHRYGDAFRDEHLVPMASALWSSPAAQILRYPARYLVQFMANHQMLQITDRPQWRVVRGGSSNYVHALRARWPVNERLNCAVRSIRRDAAGATLESAAGMEHFQLMGEKWPARHRHQRFGNFFRDGTQPRRQATGENRHGNVQRGAHELTSLVPSKSNRKRTSFKPDCRIAWRSRALSSE